MALHIAFMGTPEFAVPTLLALARKHQIVAVYTRAAKPAGRRGMALTPSPVEREACRLGLPVFTPASLRSPQEVAAARSHGADIAVVVAYGLILPKPFLDVFERGAFNLHASLLPRWRGAAPIQRAIMAGDRTSGVTVMRMEEGLDTGPIALEKPIAIGADVTAGELSTCFAAAGAELMLEALDRLEKGDLTLTPQSQTGVTYASKIAKEETRIDWSKPSRQVHDHVRGLSPFPGAWFALPPSGTRVKALRSVKSEGAGRPGIALDGMLTIACGEGAVRLVELQAAGKKAMPAEEFLRGAPIAAGTRLL